jgi:hypothetical protein
MYNSRLPRLSIVLLLVSVCLSVRGQSESTPSKDTKEPTRGDITGKVVNESGQPLAGATVVARATNNNLMGRITTSDAEGSFRIGGLETALYTIGASSPGYTSESSAMGLPGTHYRIGDNVRVEMVRGGAITGTVANAAGEPVIAVQVRAVMIRDAKGHPPKQMEFIVNQQTTDDRGIYRIWGLTPGTYLVSAGGTDYSRPFEFNPYDGDSPTYAPSSTRDTAAEVGVRSGEDTNADIRYRGEAGYTVSGTVKTMSEADPTIMLIPVSTSPGLVLTTFVLPGNKGFAFTGVSDGEYELVTQELITSRTPRFGFSEPKRITVKGANVTGIELVTKMLPSLSGRIALETSKVTECQNKRPPQFTEAMVQLQRPDKELEKNPFEYLRLFGNSASPERDGSFVFDNLVPGKYQFDPLFHARYWYLRSITLGTPATATAKSQPAKTDAAANWTVVKTGDQLTNLIITLTEGAASIRGKLTRAEGAPALAESLVYLVPSEPDKAEDVLRFFVTEVAADGSFSLNNLPPGKYRALAQITNDAQISTLTKLRQPESATARTKLRRTAVTELELKPCQNVDDYQISFKN